MSPLGKISVLTCGPGDELYSAFGHSAFRIKDQALSLDEVYNYGIFDFNASHFYRNFAFGRMDYLLGRESFDRFLGGYRYEGRWVKEQVLDLSEDQKNRLYGYLQWNARPENRVYRYDYFRNNCATKIWDVLQTNLGDSLQFDPKYVEVPRSIRQLIHLYVSPNSWAGMGIDLALGSRIDIEATPKEHLFLPDYVMRQLLTARLQDKQIAGKPITLLDARPPAPTTPFYATPLFWTLLFLGVTGLVVYRDLKNGRRSRGFDLILFLVNGMAGLLICFLWFFTSHIDAAYNYNILWAVATNVVVAFWMVRRGLPTWIRSYAVLLLGLIAVVVILGTFGVQTFTPVILCMIALMALRYAYLYLVLRNAGNGKKPTSQKQ